MNDTSDSNVLQVKERMLWKDSDGFGVHLSFDDEKEDLSLAQKTARTTLLWQKIHAISDAHPLVSNRVFAERDNEFSWIVWATKTGSREDYLVRAYTGG